MTFLRSTRGAGAPRSRRLLGAGALALGLLPLATGCATPVESADVTVDSGSDTTRRSTTTTAQRTTTTARRTTTTEAPATTTTAAPTTTTTTAPPPPPTTTTAPAPPPTTAAPAPAPEPFVAPAPAPPPAVEPQASGCHPSYSPCVPFASDVDCAGGSGNGPAYTGFVDVVGPDEYDLDRDGDGAGCE